MLGVEFDFDVSALRKKMIIENTFSADPVTKIYLESPLTQLRQSIPIIAL
jgi:hypothetical protein